MNTYPNTPLINAIIDTIISAVAFAIALIMLVCFTVFYSPQPPEKPKYDTQVVHSGGPAVLPIIKALGWYAYIISNPVAAVPTFIIIKLKEGL